MNLTFGMLFWIVFLDALAFLAIGYAIGWNRAKHPGKIEAQAATLVEKAKDAVK